MGRTGVLIAVETAMHMIEAMEPIDLMEIIRKMRDQRGMMIQSPVGVVFSEGTSLRRVHWDSSHVMG